MRPRKTAQQQPSLLQQLQQQLQPEPYRFNVQNQNQIQQQNLPEHRGHPLHPHHIPRQCQQWLPRALPSPEGCHRRRCQDAGQPLQPQPVQQQVQRWQQQLPVLQRQQQSLQHRRVAAQRQPGVPSLAYVLQNRLSQTHVAGCAQVPERGSQILQERQPQFAGIRAPQEARQVQQHSTDRGRSARLCNVLDETQVHGQQQIRIAQSQQRAMHTQSTQIALQVSQGAQGLPEVRPAVPADPRRSGQRIQHTSDASPSQYLRWQRPPTQLRAPQQLPRLQQQNSTQVQRLLPSQNMQSSHQPGPPQHTQARALRPHNANSLRNAYARQQQISSLPDQSVQSHLTGILQQTARGVELSHVSFGGPENRRCDLLQTPSIPSSPMPHSKYHPAQPHGYWTAQQKEQTLLPSLENCLLSSPPNDRTPTGVQTLGPVFSTYRVENVQQQNTIEKSRVSEHQREKAASHSCTADILPIRTQMHGSLRLHICPIGGRGPVRSLQTADKEQKSGSAACTRQVEGAAVHKRTCSAGYGGIAEGINVSIPAVAPKNSPVHHAFPAQPSKPRLPLSPLSTASRQSLSAQRTGVYRAVPRDAAAGFHSDGLEGAIVAPNISLIRHRATDPLAVQHSVSAPLNLGNEKPEYQSIREFYKTAESVPCARPYCADEKQPVAYPTSKAVAYGADCSGRNSSSTVPPLDPSAIPASAAACVGYRGALKPAGSPTSNEFESKTACDQDDSPGSGHSPPANKPESSQQQCKADVKGTLPETMCSHVAKPPTELLTVSHPSVQRRQITTTPGDLAREGTTKADTSFLTKGEMADFGGPRPICTSRSPLVVCQRDKSSFQGLGFIFPDEKGQPSYSLWSWIYPQPCCPGHLDLPQRHKEGSSPLSLPHTTIARIIAPEFLQPFNPVGAKSPPALPHLALVLPPTFASKRGNVPTRIIIPRSVHRVDDVIYGGVIGKSYRLEIPAQHFLYRAIRQSRLFHADCCLRHVCSLCPADGGDRGGTAASTTGCMSGGHLGSECAGLACIGVDNSSGNAGDQKLPIDVYSIACVDTERQRQDWNRRQIFPPIEVVLGLSARTRGPELSRIAPAGLTCKHASALPLCQVEVMISASLKEQIKMASDISPMYAHSPHEPSEQSGFFMGGAKSVHPHFFPPDEPGRVCDVDGSPGSSESGGSASGAATGIRPAEGRREVTARPTAQKANAFSIGYKGDSNLEDFCPEKTSSFFRQFCAAPSLEVMLENAQRQLFVPSEERAVNEEENLGTEEVGKTTRGMCKTTKAAVVPRAMQLQCASQHTESYLLVRANESDAVTNEAAQLSSSSLLSDVSSVAPTVSPLLYTTIQRVAQKHNLHEEEVSASFPGWTVRHTSRPPTRSRVSEAPLSVGALHTGELCFFEPPSVAEKEQEEASWQRKSGDCENSHPDDNPVQFVKATTEALDLWMDAQLQTQETFLRGSDDQRIRRQAGERAPLNLTSPVQTSCKRAIDGLASVLYEGDEWCGSGILEDSYTENASIPEEVFHFMGPNYSEEECRSEAYDVWPTKDDDETPGRFARCCEGSRAPMMETEGLAATDRGYVQGWRPPGPTTDPCIIVVELPKPEKRTVGFVEDLTEEDSHVNICRQGEACSSSPYGSKLRDKEEARPRRTAKTAHGIHEGSRPSQKFGSGRNKASKRWLTRESNVGFSTRLGRCTQKTVSTRAHARVSRGVRVKEGIKSSLFTPQISKRESTGVPMPGSSDLSVNTRPAMLNVFEFTSERRRCDALPRSIEGRINLMCSAGVKSCITVWGQAAQPEPEPVPRPLLEELEDPNGLADAFWEYVRPSPGTDCVVEGNLDPEVLFKREDEEYASEEDFDVWPQGNPGLSDVEGIGVCSADLLECTGAERVARAGDSTVLHYPRSNSVREMPGKLEKQPRPSACGLGDEAPNANRGITVEVASDNNISTAPLAAQLPQAQLRRGTCTCGASNASNAADLNLAGFQQQSHSMNEVILRPLRGRIAVFARGTETGLRGEEQCVLREAGAIHESWGRGRHSLPTAPYSGPDLFESAKPPAFECSSRGGCAEEAFNMCLHERLTKEGLTGFKASNKLDWRVTAQTPEANVQQNHGRPASPKAPAELGLGLTETVAVAGGQARTTSCRLHPVTRNWGHSPWGTVPFDAINTETAEDAGRCGEVAGYASAAATDNSNLMAELREGREAPECRMPSTTARPASAGTVQPKDSNTLSASKNVVFPFSSLTEVALLEHRETPTVGRAPVETEAISTIIFSEAEPANPWALIGSGSSRPARWNDSDLSMHVEDGNFLSAPPSCAAQRSSAVHPGLHKVTALFTLSGMVPHRVKSDETTESDESSSECNLVYHNDCLNIADTESLEGTTPLSAEQPTEGSTPVDTQATAESPLHYFPYEDFAFSLPEEAYCSHAQYEEDDEITSATSGTDAELIYFPYIDERTEMLDRFLDCFQLDTPHLEPMTEEKIASLLESAAGVRREGASRLSPYDVNECLTNRDASYHLMAFAEGGGEVEAPSESEKEQPEEDCGAATETVSLTIRKRKSCELTDTLMATEARQVCEVKPSIVERSREFIRFVNRRDDHRSLQGAGSAGASVVFDEEEEKGDDATNERMTSKNEEIVYFQTASCSQDCNRSQGAGAVRHQGRSETKPKVDRQTSAQEGEKRAFSNGAGVSSSRNAAHCVSLEPGKATFRLLECEQDESNEKRLKCESACSFSNVTEEQQILLVDGSDFQAFVGEAEKRLKTAEICEIANLPSEQPPAELLGTSQNSSSGSYMFLTQTADDTATSLDKFVAEVQEYSKKREEKPLIACNELICGSLKWPFSQSNTGVEDRFHDAGRDTNSEAAPGNFFECHAPVPLDLTGQKENCQIYEAGVDELAVKAQGEVHPVASGNAERRACPAPLGVVWKPEFPTHTPAATCLAEGSASAEPTCTVTSHLRGQLLMLPNYRTPRGSLPEGAAAGVERRGRAVDIDTHVQSLPCVRNSGDCTPTPRIQEISAIISRDTEAHTLVPGLSCFSRQAEVTVRVSTAEDTEGVLAQASEADSTSAERNANTSAGPFFGKERTVVTVGSETSARPTKEEKPSISAAEDVRPDGGHKRNGTPQPTRDGEEQASWLARLDDDAVVLSDKGVGFHPVFLVASTGTNRETSDAIGSVSTPEDQCNCVSSGVPEKPNSMPSMKEKTFRNAPRALSENITGTAVGRGGQMIAPGEQNTSNVSSAFRERAARSFAAANGALCAFTTSKLLYSPPRTEDKTRSAAELAYGRLVRGTADMKEKHSASPADTRLGVATDKRNETPLVGEIFGVCSPEPPLRRQIRPQTVGYTAPAICCRQPVVVARLLRRPSTQEIVIPLPRRSGSSTPRLPGEYSPVSSSEYSSPMFCLSPRDDLLSFGKALDNQPCFPDLSRPSSDNGPELTDLTGFLDPDDVHTTHVNASELEEPCGCNIARPAFKQFLLVAEDSEGPMPAANDTGVVSPTRLTDAFAEVLAQKTKSQSRELLRAEQSALFLPRKVDNVFGRQSDDFPMKKHMQLVIDELVNLHSMRQHSQRGNEDISTCRRAATGGKFLLNTESSFTCVHPALKKVGSMEKEILDAMNKEAAPPSTCHALQETTRESRSLPAQAHPRAHEEHSFCVETVGKYTPAREVLNHGRLFHTEALHSDAPITCRNEGPHSGTLHILRRLPRKSGAARGERIPVPAITLAADQDGSTPESLVCQATASCQRKTERAAPALRAQRDTLAAACKAAAVRDLPPCRATAKKYATIASRLPPGATVFRKTSVGRGPGAVCGGNATIATQSSTQSQDSGSLSPYTEEASDTKISSRSRGTAQFQWKTASLVYHRECVALRDGTVPRDKTAELPRPSPTTRRLSSQSNKTEPRPTTIRTGPRKTLSPVIPGRSTCSSAGQCPTSLEEPSRQALAPSLVPHDEKKSCISGKAVIRRNGLNAIVSRVTTRGENRTGVGCNSTHLGGTTSKADNLDSSVAHDRPFQPYNQQRSYSAGSMHTREHRTAGSPNSVSVTSSGAQNNMSCKRAAPHPIHDRGGKRIPRLCVKSDRDVRYIRADADTASPPSASSVVGAPMTFPLKQNLTSDCLSCRTSAPADPARPYLSWSVLGGEGSPMETPGGSPLDDKWCKLSRRPDAECSAATRRPPCSRTASTRGDGRLEIEDLPHPRAPIANVKAAAPSTSRNSAARCSSGQTKKGALSKRVSNITSGAWSPTHLANVRAKVDTGLRRCGTSSQKRVAQKRPPEQRSK